MLMRSCSYASMAGTDTGYSLGRVRSDWMGWKPQFRANLTI